MNNQETTSYHLDMLGQMVRNQLRIIEWAQGPGNDEVSGLLDLLPDPVIEFQGELVLTGRMSANHWDDVDPLLTQLQHRVGNLLLDSDEPELRIRVFRASGHPYLTVKLRVTVPSSSEQLIVGCRIHDNPIWEYYWIDKKRER